MKCVHAEAADFLRLARPGRKVGPKAAIRYYNGMTMDWRAALAVSVLVGLGSGVVCAKEFGVRQFAAPVAAVPTVTGAEPLPVGVSAFPDDKAGGRTAAHDPALELLASNPYESRLAPYRAALDIDGEHPLLEDPYEDTRRFVNPYENTVGIANPYVDTLRDRAIGRQARLDNPYTKQLREDFVNLENPYARHR
jgi:hypothetical protein